MCGDELCRSQGREGLIRAAKFSTKKSGRGWQQGGVPEMGVGLGLGMLGKPELGSK